MTAEVTDDRREGLIPRELASLTATADEALRFADDVPAIGPLAEFKGIVWGAELWGDELWDEPELLRP